MDKKKFKDTQVGKFLLNKIPDVVGAIAGNTPVGSVIQAIIGGSDMSDGDKQIALKKLDIKSIIFLNIYISYLFVNIFGNYFITICF